MGQNPLLEIQFDMIHLMKYRHIFLLCKMTRFFIECPVLEKYGITETTTLSVLKSQVYLQSSYGGLES